MEENLSYRDVLLEIDRLRAQGIKDSDPKMKSLKLQLWGHLEKKRKSSKKNSSVPTIMAVKTVKLNALKPKKDQLVKVETEKETQVKVNPNLGERDDKPYAKYFLLGVVAAVVFVGYKFYTA